MQRGWRGVEPAWKRVTWLRTLFGRKDNAVRMRSRCAQVSKRKLLRKNPTVRVARVVIARLLLWKPAVSLVSII